MSPSRADTVAGVVSAAPGKILAGLVSATGRVRTPARPLHPTGVVRRATIQRGGCAWATGVPFVDEPGSLAVIARLSRSIGTPDGWPDVLGLALRVPTPDGHGDLLLATTGHSCAGRWLLQPRMQVAGATFTSLMPYRSPTGPVLVAAQPEPDGRTFMLAVARPLGAWSRFAQLEVHDEPLGPEDDPVVSFDPVLNQVPGLTSYAWAASLREGAYRAARRSRGDGGAVS